MTYLFLHQILSHYGITYPAGSSNREDETQRRVQCANCCQILQHVRNTHFLIIYKRLVNIITYSLFVILDYQFKCYLYYRVILIIGMQKGFDEAEGWQRISTQYSSHDTTISVLKMYQLQESIVPTRLYAFKIMTISKPISIVSTKSIQKILLKSKDIRKIKAEIFALQKLRGYSSIIELYQVLVNNQKNNDFFHQFMDKQNKNIALILQYCPNGTLHRYIRQNSLFGQLEITRICLQILQILKALKECQILHRDFRSANLLMFDKGLKLIDFDCCFIKGYSQACDFSYSFAQAITAPQIKALLKEFDFDDHESSERIFSLQQKCDLYAFGTIIFEMIYKTQYRKDTKNIQNIDGISQQLFNLMNGLLNQDPVQRTKHQQVQSILKILAEKHKIEFISTPKHELNKYSIPSSNIQSDTSFSSCSRKSSASLSDWSFSSQVNPSTLQTQSLTIQQPSK